MTSDLDIGPLSWVKSEIDLALEHAAAALIERAQHPEGNSLAAAVKNLHQAHGALTIVGLDGITEFSSVLERLFEQLASGALAWSDDAAATAQEAIRTLRAYLDGLMDGNPNQTLRLMPAYAAMLAAGGAPAPSPSALFFPDLSQRPPRRDVEPPVLAADKLAGRLKMARMGCERGLLKALKNEPEEGRRGYAEMKTAIAMIEATQSSPADRALWWVATAVFESLANDAYANVADADDLRKLAMRIGTQVKHFCDGQRDIPERLLADTLYYVAICPTASALSNVVRSAYRLDDLVPRAQAANIDSLLPQIRHLRETLASAREDWNKLCSGSAAALPPFHEKIAQAGEQAAGLGNADLSAICSALVSLTDALRRDPSRHNDVMAIEVATALLLIDSALENFASLDADFTGHAQTVVERLQALMAQRDLDVLAIPQLDAMARRAQERLLLSTVAQEIQANLSVIEQTLDAYFRDTSKLASLSELTRPLKQIEGALMILGQTRAVDILNEAARRIDALIKGTQSADKAVFETLAGQLSGLGFFVEEIERGSTPDIDLILAPRKTPKVAPEAPAQAAVSAEDEISALAPADTPTLALPDVPTEIEPPAAAPDFESGPPELSLPELARAEPVPGPAEPTLATPTLSAASFAEPEVDAELLEIFLEEAHEVLAAIAEQLPLVHSNPNDSEAMTTLRRSYHTLKGSGRMVDLNEFGEAAWGIEQLLNQWLHEKRPASPALLAMLERSHEVFSAWIAQLAAGGSAHYDAAELNRQSAALLAGEIPADTAITEVAAEVTELTESPNAEPASSIDESAVAEADDTQSLSDLLAKMEAHEAVDEARKVESALEAAELDVAEAEAEAAAAASAAASNAIELAAAIAVPPALTFAEPTAETLTDAVPDATVDSADSEHEPPVPIEASALPSVSDDELLAAELAAAEAWSVSVDTPTTGGDATPEAPEVPEPAEVAEATEITEPDEVAEPDEAPASADILPFPNPEPVRVGNVEISPTLFAIYIEEAQQHMATIQAEASGGDVPSDNLIRAAHTLGSTSGTTGIEAIHHLARALEVALGGLSIINVPPTDEQRLLLARCSGALEGMLGAVLARRLPSEEIALTNELRAMKPEPTARPEDAFIAAALANTTENAPVSPVVEPLSAEILAPTELDFALPDTPVPDVPPPVHPDTDEDEEEHRHSNRLGDEIDEQLLPIFLEEAADLMASIDAQLRGWRGQPDNDAFSKQLQRDLHTIKGSARMAGAMGCGDLFHSMESRIEQASALRAVNSDLFDSLETSYDRGAMLIERLQRGEFGPIDAPPPEPARAATSATPSAPAPTAAVGTATTATGAPAAPAGQPHGPAKAQIQLRVRADLIDSLVNEAGEVAIARARIEGEMRALKTSLLELTDNVIRLRQQVREIEIQAETQMASQITELKAQAEVEGRAFDPLEFDKFTRFQELTRMMAESVNDVSTVQHSLFNNITSADAALTAQARINRELSQRLMGVRMMPFESMAERLHRVVRQAAKDVGKRANLDIKGGQMGIDRSVLEHIGGPLEHLLRNSVAHGIEDPDSRAAAHKDPFGQITLSLAQEGNDVVLALADDGAGLNLKKIRQRAIERGLMSEDDPTDDAHLIGMIFQSGFSTADAVSTIAGRGVGMDVVKTEIEALGGRIEVSTTPGKGSVFRLYLPLTLAVSQAVIILVGHRSYALPASMVEQVSELKPEAIAKIREAGHSEWLGRKYPYRYLPQLLGMRDARPVAARRHWLLLIKGGAERLAIEIDGMIGNREIVIKNLGQQLRRIPGLAGATVLGNGEIGMILNPIALQAKLMQVEAAAQLKATAISEGDATAIAELAEEEVLAAAAAAVPAAPTRRQPSDATVMVVDDSLTVRKVTGRLLGRQGYQVVTAKDGVDALEQLTDVRPDVMLVDIEMPRMDGFELTRNIRADHKLKGIPIIMITSRSADKHRTYAKEIGVNHYLGKPYDETLLLGLIDTFVNPPAPEGTPE